MSIPEQQTNWKQSWQDGKIGFHLSNTNPSLQEYAHLLEHAETILVPLCGKTLDMHFLHQKGHAVIGVDLVSKAIHDFFQEWGVQPQTVKNLSRHEQITLINDNIFAVQPQNIPIIDGVFDRAALVALPTSIRPQYAAHILSLLKDGGTLLLITYDMPRPQEQGPPFAVRQEDVPRLFSQATSVELLKEIYNTPKEEPRLTSRNLAWSKEHIWHITK